ncbi:MAG: hypothetical protein JW816_03190 [Candidatus Buchananbacteria bacterium]|nr:hypothetical protein [Candidatus Buchananbacteria bacterium]
MEKDDQTTLFKMIGGQGLSEITTGFMAKLHVFFAISREASALLALLGEGGRAEWATFVRSTEFCTDYPFLAELLKYLDESEKRLSEIVGKDFAIVCFMYLVKERAPLPKSLDELQNRKRG